MRKKIVILLLVAIITQCLTITGVLVFMLGFSENAGDASALPVSDNTITTIESSNIYNIEAEVSMEKNSVMVQELLKFESAADKLYINAPSKNISLTTVTKITADSQVTGTNWHGNTLEIITEQPCDRVSIEYSINLNDDLKTLSMQKNKVLLTNFLMTPAVFKGDNPVFIYHSDFGDPYIYGTNNYSVSIKADKSYKVYAPGKTDERIVGTKKITLCAAENYRDFSIVLALGDSLKAEQFGDITIYYVDSEKTMEHVKKAFSFAEKNIGPYPYKEFFVVRTPLELKGMEFSGMIFLSDSIYKSNDLKQLERVTYHEVLHQWFYGIIGTDQINEPYFDEGLANYLSIVLSGGTISGSSSNKFSSYSLRDFSNKPEYMHIAYTESSQYLKSQHRRLGDKFYSALQRLYQQKKFSTAYFSDFEKCLQYYSGGN